MDTQRQLSILFKKVNSKTVLYNNDRFQLSLYWYSIIFLFIFSFFFFNIVDNSNSPLILDDDNADDDDDDDDG